MQTLASVLSLAVIEKQIIPTLESLVTDDIPNIRFNVAKSYAVLVDVLKRVPETGTIESNEKEGNPLNGCKKGVELIQERVMPHLEKLQQDDDVDVRYFASTAAQGWGDAMQT